MIATDYTNKVTRSAELGEYIAAVASIRDFIISQTSQAQAMFRALKENGIEMRCQDELTMTSDAFDQISNLTSIAGFLEGELEEAKKNN